MTDDTAIARWCIQNRESEPHLWERRHDWVCDAAEDFVAEHQQEIVPVAEGLFGRGIITLGAGILSNTGLADMARDVGVERGPVN